MILKIGFNPICKLNNNNMIYFLIIRIRNNLIFLKFNSCKLIKNPTFTYFNLIINMIFAMIQKSNIVIKLLMSYTMLILLLVRVEMISGKTTFTKNV